MLRDLPDANGSEIDLFLKRYICKNPNVKSPTEKKKKEAFKKLVAGVISVGSLLMRKISLTFLDNFLEILQLCWFIVILVFMFGISDRLSCKFFETTNDLCR